MKFNRNLYAVGIATLGLLTVAQAQTFGRNAYGFSGVTNSGFTSPNIHNLDWMYDPNGGYVEASAVQDFSGIDSNEVPQTMTFSASSWASANFGQLKTSAHGSIENSFYNSSNPWYFNPDTNEVDPNGVPTRFFSVGQAQYFDEFLYSNVPADFKVNFIYHIDGQLSGVRAFHSLYLQNDQDSDSILLESNGGNTTIGQNWASKKFAVGADLKLEHKLTVVSQFDFEPEFNPEGQDYSGTADFGSTVTLVGMNLYDANDNLVTGWSMNSASGTNYEAVPEPATMTVFAIAALAAIKRRKK